MEVLLTGSESAKGIIAARALGKMGINFFTSSYVEAPASSFSKYSSGHFVYPDPEEYPLDFVKKLTGFLQKENVQTVIPLHSREMKIISKYKNEIGKYSNVPVVSYDKFNLVNNKASLTKLAQKLGIRIPKTFHPININDIKDKEIRYPVVIKILEGQGNKGLSYAYDYNDLKRKFEKTINRFSLEPDNYPIVQEYIDGKGLGTSVLYNKGQMMAFVSHQRLREYPSTGGPSTYRVSVRNREAEKMSKILLDSLDWHGVAMLEYKIDKFTNKPYLLEINPRFWGSLNQAIVSGINFPYWLHLISKGDDLNFEKKVSLGIKTRFLPLDILAFPGYYRQTKDKISLFLSYISFLDISFDLESLSDPKPTFRYYIEKLKKINQ